MDDINPTISDTELQRSYWFVTHYTSLRRGLCVALAALSVLLYGLSAWGATSFYLLSADGNAALKRQLTERVTNNSIPITPITLIRSGGVEGADGVRDFFVILANRNTDWYARAQFVVRSSGGEMLARKEALLLPGEERTLVALGLSEDAGKNAAVSLENIRYGYMTDRERTLKEEKMKIIVSDIRFVPASQSGVTRLIPVSKLRFTVENKTTSHFWEVRLPVIVRNSGRIQSVHEAVLSSLSAGERKNVEVSWYAAVNEGDTVDIVPLVDILDRASYRRD